MSTKIVKNTLSEESSDLRTPKGNGSNALTPGIMWRFTRHQPVIRTNSASRNPTLPTTFVITSLTRSVGVRRLRASSSNLAIASMLYCVGFTAAWGGNEFSMRQLLKTVPERRGRGSVFFPEFPGFPGEDRQRSEE